MDSKNKETGKVVEKKTEENKKVVPHMVGTITFQGLRKDFSFIPEELQNPETVKNKLHLTFRDIFNQFKRNVEAQAKLYPFIKDA